MPTWLEFKKKGVEFLHVQKKDSSGADVYPLVYVCRAPANVRHAVQVEVEERAWKMAIAIVNKRERDSGFRLGDAESTEQKHVHPVIAAMVPWVPYVDHTIPRFGHCTTCGEKVESHSTADCPLCNAARKRFLRMLGYEIM